MSGMVQLHIRCGHRVAYLRGRNLLVLVVTPNASITTLQKIYCITPVVYTKILNLRDFIILTYSVMTVF